MADLDKIWIRKSQLAQWRICPRIYESVWILHLPDQPAVEQQFGSLFHGYAKQFFDVVDYDELLKCKTAQEALLSFHQDLSVAHPVVGPWVENFLIFEANRWQFIAERAKEPLHWWTPVATEKELVVEAKGMEMHIDRIDRLSTGTLINIEYKTNKWWSIPKLRWELAFYNIGVNASSAFTEPCTHIGALNPQLNKWFSQECSQRLIQSTNRLILQFKRAVKLGEFPPRPSQFCRYCSFIERCLNDGTFNEMEG